MRSDDDGTRYFGGVSQRESLARAVLT